MLTGFSPAIRFRLPNISRWVPSTGSMPMVEQVSPSRAMTIPLITLSPAMPMTVHRPKMHREKYSGAWMFSDALAIMGAKNSREAALSSPPTPDATSAVFSASAARPFRFRG